MLDQSFSYENLKEIYDLEKRKGSLVDKMFISADKIAKANADIKDVYKEIKTEKLKFSKTATKKLSDKEKETVNLKIDGLEAKLTEAKEKKNNLLKKEFEKISNELDSSKFTVKIEKIRNFLDSKKPLYSIQNDIKGFLFKKHIQKQLNSLYKIKQSNRYLIVNQVDEILNKNTSIFNVIKFDISNFYESVDLSYLEKKLLTDDNLLSPKIKNHITNILAQYKTLSKSNTGIPRGIGLSAYLGELYMRDFDHDMQKNDEIFFYARYVDDIIIITARDSSFNLDKVILRLKKIKLQLKGKKTFNLRDAACKDSTFDYLGYSFSFDHKGATNETVKIDISEKRFERYKKRIETAFNAYQKTQSYGRMAAKYLFLRVRFLVSNVRLTGEKDNILSGIYYSNKLIESPVKFEKLDKYLKSKVKTIKSKTLKKKLETLSFKDGYLSEPRDFFYLKKNKVGDNKESKELGKLLKIWEYVK